MADGQATRKTFAVLVDGENAPPDVLKIVLQEVEKNGEARVRLVFGGTESLQGHKDNANTFGFRPVMRYKVAQRKNAADITMAIEAIDLLHSGKVDAFCIVSSDSDFHPLATRLREEGRFVLGIGRDDTPDALKSACHRFVSFDILEGSIEAAPPTAKGKSKATPVIVKQPVGDSAKLHAMLAQAYQNAQGEDGWASLGAIGNQLRILEPGFDSRKYGSKQLWILVQETGLYEFNTPPPGSPAQPLAVKPKVLITV
jgi:uncharacterized protein (TIGR00288 family)